MHFRKRGEVAREKIDSSQVVREEKEVRDGGKKQREKTENNYGGKNQESEKKRVKEIRSNKGRKKLSRREEAKQ